MDEASEQGSVIISGISEEEALESTPQMKRHKGKGHKEIDDLMLAEPEPVPELESLAPRRLRYSFSTMPIIALEKGKDAFWVAYSIMKAILITYPEQIAKTGSFIGATDINVHIVRASQQFASMSWRGKQNFYASFFTALIMALFALQSIISHFTMQPPIANLVPAPDPTAETLLSELSFASPSKVPTSSEPAMKEPLILTEEMSEILQGKVPDDKDSASSYWGAVTTSLRALLPFGVVSHDKAIQALRGRLLSLSTDIKSFSLVSSRHILNLEPSKLQSLLLAHPDLIDEEAPLRMLRHINISEISFTDDLNGNCFWSDIERLSTASLVVEGEGDSADTEDGGLVSFDAAYDTRPELFSCWTLKTLGIGVHVLFSYILLLS